MGAFSAYEDAKLIHFTTTGHRTGLPREKWWLPFAPDGDVLYLIEEEHTRAHWVQNLLADPHVVVEGEPALARVVTDPDEDARARRICKQRFERVGLIVQDLIEWGLVVAFDHDGAVPSGS